MLGIDGMLLDNYSALRTMGRGIESPEVIKAEIWEICQIGFFANAWFLYAVGLGLLLILQTMKWNPFNRV